jgi:two-component system, LytTR family, response regulator
MITASILPLQPVKPNDLLRALPALKKSNWQKLAVFLNDEIRFIPFDDILYCRSKSNYTHIHTLDGACYLYCKTLKEVERKLPAENFIRIHHSYLVQLNFITALKKQTQEIELNNKQLLPYSRLIKNELYSIFGLR